MQYVILTICKIICAFCVEYVKIILGSIYSGATPNHMEEGGVLWL